MPSGEREKEDLLH